jgi:hypothetical protein
MKLNINKQVFDIRKKNEEFLAFANKYKIFRFNNNTEHEIMRKYLQKIGFFKDQIREVVILCKKCKKRYGSFTDGAMLHCDCHTVYWESDGHILNIYAPSNSYAIIFKNIEDYAPDSDTSKK